MNTVKAIYPGSFDPLTNGHLDLVARGAKIFDHLVVAILKNSEKAPLFSVAERIEMITEAVTPFGNVSVATFNGLLVEFVVKERAQAILRGVRAISDYEYELQMALMNRRLARACELLANTSLSVGEIAHRCGFASSQHLAAVTRRRLATTPTAYRRQILS